MSNKESAQGAGVFSSLVTKIMAILKLDDAGKLDKFFKGEVKSLNNEIKTIEMNKQTAALEHEMKLSEIDSKIEDAEAAVEDAYTAVETKNIDSNEAMKDFSSRYWENIDRKEEGLELLIKKREHTIKCYEEELKGRNEKIDKRKARIAKIS